MTYTMTEPCPICKQRLTKQKPTETVPCMCGHMFGRDSAFMNVRGRNV
jgi:hypothetical protein